MTSTPFAALPIGARFALEDGYPPFWIKAGDRWAVAIHKATMTISVASDRPTFAVESPT
jgi:hypothetical protein